MTPQKVIRETEENCSEYLEMMQDPSAFVAEVLANKIVKMQFYIEYLEARVKYASKS